MEDVLSVYELPYDAKRPVICVDEGKKELRSTPRKELPAEPGQVKREDYEYVREGEKIAGAISLARRICFLRWNHWWAGVWSR